MVMPCSRSALSPSVTSEIVDRPGAAVLGRGRAAPRAIWSSGSELRVVQEPADERRLAVVDAAQRADADQVRSAVAIKNSPRVSSSPSSASGVVVDDARAALRDARGAISSSMIAGIVVGRGADGAAARRRSQGCGSGTGPAAPAARGRRRIGAAAGERAVEHQQLAAAHDHLALAGEVERVRPGCCSRSM